MKRWSYGEADLFRQFNKNKRHKYGIKLYCLMEPQGQVLLFMIYCGVLYDLGAKGQAANVVLHLMHGRFNVANSLLWTIFITISH